MIYLIREKFVNLDIGKLVDLLKIGYTEDSNFKDRMSQYRLHCPGFKLLLTINECDDRIEKALHRYFREYFELKDCKVLNSETGKYEHGFELIKKKE